MLSSRFFLSSRVPSARSDHLAKFKTNVTLFIYQIYYLLFSCYLSFDVVTCRFNVICLLSGLSSVSIVEIQKKNNRYILLIVSCISRKLIFVVSNYYCNKDILQKWDYCYLKENVFCCLRLLKQSKYSEDFAKIKLKIAI